MRYLLTASESCDIIESNTYSLPRLHSLSISSVQSRHSNNNHTHFILKYMLMNSMHNEPTGKRVIYERE
jgi:hypothetical protein